MSAGNATLRSDAARNRERLLAAAEQVFAERGLDGGVEEVARVAGVGIGTLYRRFPTKEALVGALVEDTLRQMFELAEAASNERHGRGLERFLEAATAFQAAHRGSLRRLWSYDASHEQVAALRRSIARLLDDAKANGRARSELSETDISLLLWSVRGVIETTGDAAPDAWRRHLAILLAGLRPADPPLSPRAMTRAQLRRVIAAGAERQH